MQLTEILKAPRHTDLRYHHSIAGAWLEAGKELHLSAPLAYAAFELRLALARLTLELLLLFRDGSLEARDGKQLAGTHSLVGYLLQMPGAKETLRRKMLFHAIVSRCLESGTSRALFEVGRLSGLWDKCAAWERGASPEPGAGGQREVDWADAELLESGYRDIAEVHGFMVEVLQQHGAGWKTPLDSRLRELQKAFLRGKLKPQELEAILLGNPPL